MCAVFTADHLNRKDLNVQKVHAQHDVKNLQGRSIRLDIIAIERVGVSIILKSKEVIREPALSGQDITAVCWMQM